MAARGADALAAALDAADAAAFVHVGDDAADIRYLAGFAPERPLAYVQTADGDRTLCPARPDAALASESFDGAVRVADAGSAPGARAVGLLAERGAAGEVLVPPDVPHVTAVRLEDAGFEVASTDAVAAARAVKDDAEVERLRAVQEAASAGVRAAESALARADRADDGLVRNGEPLTTGRLRRLVNTALAAADVDPAGGTLVATGADAATPRAAGDARVRTAETVVVDVAPRGPAGYRGRLARTFVVDTDGGWDRRAFLAVEAARDAGLAELVAGAEADRVHEEMVAEALAYGFAATADGDAGFTRVAGHGVGLSRREAPSLAGPGRLEAGHVAALVPEVVDPAAGGVRIADVALVTDRGRELLADRPVSLSPRPSVDADPERQHFRDASRI